MKSRRDKGRIAGAFVPMLKDTMAAAAWRTMSSHARVLYIALKSRYSFKDRNNGRIYLSVRQAAKETGLNKDTLARCFRELQHYGFIVQTDPGCLGVEGRGKAPHWRLTELGYMTDLPTRNFMRWDGAVFHDEQKPPEYYKRQERRLARLAAVKKQNPVLTSQTPCLDVPDIPLSGSRRHSPNKLSGRRRHTADPACLDVPDISRGTISDLEKRSGKQSGKGQGSAAVMQPVPDDDLEIPDDLSIPAFMRR